METSINEAIEYYKMASEEDLKTAQTLFATRRYADCLFFCFLSIQRIFKAVVVKKTDEHISLMATDMLLELAEDAGITLSKEQEEDVIAINSFDRFDFYTSDYYKRATKSYTQKYLLKTEQLRSWLLKQL